MCPGAKVGNGWKPIRQKPIGAMIPGALAPTSLDFDCVFSMLATWRDQYVIQQACWFSISPSSYHEQEYVQPQKQ